MTNVPGFIPKPYPIVIFPGTFVIILQKVAVDFFRIMDLWIHGCSVGTRSEHVRSEHVRNMVEILRTMFAVN